jgi:hypothetical protein
MKSLGAFSVRGNPANRAPLPWIRGRSPPRREHECGIAIALQSQIDEFQQLPQRRQSMLCPSFAAALAAAFAVTSAGWCQAQVIGPGGTPLAPGVSPQGYTPGGLGPGGTRVAPGSAAAHISISRIGPGGTRLAPRGVSDSRIQRREVDTSPPLGSSGTIAGSIVSGSGRTVRHHRAHRPHRRHRPTS